MSASGSGASQGATSRIPGMRDLAPGERREAIAAAAGLEPGDATLLAGGGLGIDTANGMIENVVGTFELPLGIATNFLINGRDRLIPMAVEEPSVVAAASYMARLVRPHGGFSASTSEPVMRGQVQLLGLGDLEAAKAALIADESAIAERANGCDPLLVSLGGGYRGMEVHAFADTPAGPMLVLHLLIDVRDAMGANTVNTMAEAVAPLAERLTGGEARLRILSNLADRRLARACLRLPFAALDTPEFGGERMARGIVEACALALVDPYRAATHNKGIMNGIDPVILATGNDWRAIEAGAHAYAARSGRYTSLTRWEIDDGHLTGEIELPMAVGLVGGATRTHPAAGAAIRLMGVETAAELAEICAAIGLAQNMAALRALATEGIQRGHMALHARNIAISVGAQGSEIDEIARRMAGEKDVRADRAITLLAELRGS